jgi:hypothetical protein
MESMLMQKNALAGLAVAAVLLAARTASADVCVAVDTTRDTLSEQDRNATRILLGQALHQHGLTVSEQNCMGTYVVYHVRLGNSITVFLQGPQGYREGSARAIEEVPALYSQMVRSMMSGQPMTTSNNTVDRSNVIAAQQAPNRVQADSLWYLRLGYGAVWGSNASGGPGFGLGYRYELDVIAVDLSMNLLMADDDDPATEDAGVTGSWAKLMALYFFDPMGNGSFYLGGGAAWGGTATRSNGETLSGSGLQGEIAAGYEFLRASTIRLFAEANATLPFYSVSPGYGSLSTSREWAPSFMASIGVGLGRGGVLRVHQVP